MELEKLLKKHKLTQKQYDVAKIALDKTPLDQLPLAIIRLHSGSTYNFLIRTSELLKELEE